MSQQSVIVFGARRCGKSVNAERIKKALGLQHMVDDFWFAAGRKVVLSNTLYLTSEDVPERYQHLVLTFDAAMAKVKGGVA